MRLPQGYQAAGQLQQSEVVLGLLRPAHEQGAVAIQPGVGGLHDPAPGAPAGDVGRSSGILFSVGASSGWSWRPSPSCASPIGTPAASQRSERFAPSCLDQWGWGRSPRRRAAPCSWRRRRPATTSRCPPPRRSRAAPGARSHGRPGALPLLEASMGAAGVADLRGAQGVPLHAGAQHQQDGVHDLPVGDAPAVSAQGVRWRWRQERLDALPEPVRDAPAIVAVDESQHEPQGGRFERLAQGVVRRRLRSSYRDRS